MQSCIVQTANKLPFNPVCANFNSLSYLSDFFTSTDRWLFFPDTNFEQRISITWRQSIYYSFLLLTIFKEIFCKTLRRWSRHPWLCNYKEDPKEMVFSYFLEDGLLRGEKNKVWCSPRLKRCFCTGGYQLHRSQELLHKENWGFSGSNFWISRGSQWLKVTNRALLLRNSVL